ncbi:hypothetical protein [Labilibaculum euxinus]
MICLTYLPIKQHFNNRTQVTIIIAVLSVMKSVVAQEVVLVAGGDVEWSIMVKAPGVYFGIKDNNKLMREDGWRRLPYLTNSQAIKYIEENFQKVLVSEKAII